MDERAGGGEPGRTPPTEPTRPGDVPAEKRDAGEQVMEAYHTASETVGFLPSLRWRDNLAQLLFVAVVTGGCALVGYLSPGTIGILGANVDPRVNALVAGVIGLVGSVFVSGLALMVLGWVRAARRRGGERGRRG